MSLKSKPLLIVLGLIVLLLHTYKAYAGDYKTRHNPWTRKFDWVRSDDTTFNDVTISNLLSIDTIQFDTSIPDPEHAEGLMHWNSTDGTIEVGMSGGLVQMQMGQEILFRVTNKTGSDIPNGKVVYINGAQGSRPTIALADNTDPDTWDLAGITTEDIDNNTNGYICAYGFVRGDETQPIDTSAFAEGSNLYLDISGNLTSSHPSEATEGVIILGTTIVSHATNGVIMVEAPNSFALGNNYDGTMRNIISNKNTGTAAASGFTAVNDQGYRATFGIGGSNNTSFPNISVIYGPGYGDMYQAVDGNKDFVWFTDPTDSHNNSSLNYERLRLEADGTMKLANDMTIGDSLTIENTLEWQHIYGDLYTYENNVSISLGTADQYYTITDMSANGSFMTTLDGSNGTITIQKEGLYQVNVNLSAAANKVCILHGDLWINGSDSERISFRRKIATVNQYGNMSSPIQHVNLYKDDVLDFRLKSDVANTTVSIDHAGISVSKTGSLNE